MTLTETTENPLQEFEQSTPPQEESGKGAWKGELRPASSPAEGGVASSPSCDALVDLEEDKNNGKSSVPSSIFNLCNSIVGAGVLSMPTTFQSNGLIFQIIILLMMAALMGYTGQAIIRNGLKSGCSNYERAVSRLVSPKAGSLLMGAISVTMFGAMVAYSILIGDFADAIYKRVFDSGSHREVLIIFICFIVCYPLCLLKSVDSLKFTSFMAVVFIGFFAFCLTYDSIEHAKDEKENLKSFKASTDFFLALPISVMAYQCHVLLFPIYNQVKDKNLPKMKKVINSSFLMTGIGYSLIGFMGYLRFTDDVEGNVLNNYDEDDVDNRDLFLVVQVAFLFVIIFSYPLVTYATRTAFCDLFYRGKEVSYKKTVVIVSVAVFAAVLLALFIADVSVVFSLIGSVASPWPTLIIPGAMCVKTYQKEHNGEWKRGEGIIGVCLIIGGIALGILGLTLNIIDLI
eukprot:GCRY01000246.1.p1 GENE.GCRY01000246.1~~GCRY01000246.1.p1  ORF type:complete len:458 (-),score=75.55 GCRY01000246.1:254-1627(-)